jgi:polyhydroxyalkanoate synthesis regulator protein
MLVPRYLEVSIDSFTKEQEKFRQQMAQAFGVANLVAPLEDQARRNIEMFQSAIAMFRPFPLPGEKPAEGTNPARPGGEMDELKRKLEDMQKRLDRLADKDDDKTPA